MINFEGIKFTATKPPKAKKEPAFGCKNCGCEPPATIKQQPAMDQVKFTGPLTSER